MTDQDRDELLSRLGLESKRSTGEAIVSAMLPFGVGLLVGAGVALLLAPGSGRALRQAIASKLDGLGSRADPDAGQHGDGGFDPDPEPDPAQGPSARAGSAVEPGQEAVPA